MAYSTKDRLAELGIGLHDYRRLKLSAKAMHKWHELKCGMSNKFASYSLVYGRKVDGEFVYDEKDGKPHLEWHYHMGGATTYQRHPDYHGRAIRQIEDVLWSRRDLGWYEQTDPRGCALYIYRKADLNGRNIETCYSSVGTPVI